MDTFLHFSVATSLALHAMAFISSQPDRLVSAREIASALDGSEAHLHKVLKLLVKANILKSVRGPKGGVMLRKPVENIKLLDIVESIEGTIKSKNCLFETQKCSSNRCIMGNLLTLVNTQVLLYLKNATLLEVSGAFDSLTHAPLLMESTQRQT
ncbi:MAG: Rrf2 family transcriptional regulator [Candidatus Latescibacter sp.]|nr:Rrf2 family transcriptional regulator [Candidatus Latescibacter sp.]